MSDRFLTAAEVAERLGFSAGWVLDRWEAGELAGYQFGRKGGRVRFCWADVEVFLDNRRRGPKMKSGQLSKVKG